MEMENSLKSILYLTVNTVNNKIYIGIHITETPYEFDNYYGDGITGTSSYWFKHPKYPFLRACKKYGLKVFKRYTLMVFDTYEEAQKMERIIVNEDFIKRSDTYNIALGGGSGLVPSVEIEVHQYDLEGNYIRTYRSKSDACRKNSFSMSALQNAIICKGVCNNSYWSETKMSTLQVKDYVKPQACTVYIYNTSGNYIREYDSISSLSKCLEVNIDSVRRAIERRTKCGGYYISKEKVPVFNIKCKKRNFVKNYYQYNLDGSYIKECSIEEVKDICGSNYKKFHDAVRGNYSCAGFMWSKTKLDSLKPLKTTLKKHIYQYDLNGNLVKIWNSYRECNKEFSALRQVLKGIRRHINGFTFKYELEN